MRFRDHFQQRFGFTRSELVVIGLLCAGLMAGTVVRGLRSTQSTVREFRYGEADSALVRGARAMHAELTARQRTGTPQGAARPVDINAATAAELIALPGIGPAMAGRIIAFRQEHGPFARVEDLDRVKGIGPATLKRLRPFLLMHGPGSHGSATTDTPQHK